MHWCWCTYADALMWMYWCWYTDDDGCGCGRGLWSVLYLWSVLSVKLIRTRTSLRTFPAHSDLGYSLIPIIFRPHCEKLILAKVFWLITGSDFHSPLSPPFTRELNQNTYRSHESSPRKQEVINFSPSEQVRHWYSPVKSGGSGRYIVSIFSGLVLIF